MYRISFYRSYKNNNVNYGKIVGAYKINFLSDILEIVHYMANDVLPLAVLGIL